MLHKHSIILIMVLSIGTGFAAYSANPNFQCCSCNDLKPINAPSNSRPQTMPSPFRIRVSADRYNHDNSRIQVDLVSDGGNSFRDFILVAWPIENRVKTAMGRFSLIGKEYTAREICLSNLPGSHAIQTADQSPKQNVSFLWDAGPSQGHLEFRASFIVDDEIYWVAEKSPIIIDTRISPPVLTTEAPVPTPPINVAECGQSKGCYREPAGCWEPYCEYIVTWQSSPDKIRFEMSGLGDGAGDRFIAVGLSNDTYMGEDVVFACAHDSADGSTRVYVSYNDGKHNIDLGRNANGNAISEEEGSYYNDRIRCRFTVERDLFYYYPEFYRISAEPYHLLMARGFANKGRLRRHGLGVNELPIASPSKVSLNSYSNIGDRARYPLVKAHGCLMILAWIFFASIGLLLTKYYKPMWPNKRMFDERYWFVGHVSCMANMFLFTVIAIIIIFIEAGGWSLAPDLPQRAHPILGIIIFICIIINPILALIRPSEDNKCRPVFNWFHWAFGTIANVLAIPQIFIGMDFGKANVPWWATWILVIWVIIHIAVELSLEIHQCCTYKKNKDRRRKYEQQKRESPKLHIEEPEPAGRRFKRFMLYLHLTVTVIVTLIMIIVIAVA